MAMVGAVVAAGVSDIADQRRERMSGLLRLVRAMPGSLLLVFLLVVFLSLALLSAPVHSAPPSDCMLPVDAQVQHRTVYSCAFEVHDPGRLLTVEQLLRRLDRPVTVGAALPLKRVFQPEHGFYRGAYWLYVPMHNAAQSSVDLVLEPGYWVLDHVSVYVRRQNGVTESYKVGRMDFAPRLSGTYMEPAVPLQLAAQEHVDLWVRVQSSTSVYMPFTIAGQDVYRDGVYLRSVVRGVFYGLALGILLFFVVVSLIARRRQWLLQILYVLAVVVSLSSEDTTLNLLLPQSEYLHRTLLAAGLMSLMLLAMLIVRGQLELPAKGRLRQIWQLLFWVASGLCLLAVLGVDLWLLPYVSISVGLAYLLLLCGLAVVQEKPYAGLVLLTWLGPMVAGVMGMSALFGADLINSGWEFLLKGGFAINLALLSLGMGLELRALEAGRFSLRQNIIDSERREKEKSELVARVSHELRTPLTSITGVVEILRGTSLSPEQLKLVNALESSGQMLLQVANEVLDYSGLERGAVALRPEEFNVRQLVEECLVPFRNEAARKNIDLYAEFAAEMPVYMTGDAARIRQIVVNLVSNAVKFTHSGEVRLMLEYQFRQAIPYLQVTVSDTGVGMSVAQLEGLFDAPVLAPVERHGQMGTAISLSICRQLARLMEGDLQGRSESGRGSTFVLSLRIRMETVARRFQLAGIENLKEAHIVIADRNIDYAESLARQMTIMGVHAVAVASGMSCLQHMEAAYRNGWPVTHLAMSLELPDMNALNLLRQVRTDWRYKELPGLVFYLPQIQPSSIILQRAGAAYAIEKPVLVDELVQALLRVSASDPLAMLSRKAEDTRGAYLREAPLALRVLVAEDKRPNQQVMLGMLKRLGIDADMAENGVRVLEMLEQNGRYDLILMDCEMPIKDGYQAAREIRELERSKGWPRIAVVAVTAHVIDRYISDAYAAGMDDHVLKPVSFSDLAACIDKWKSSLKGAHATAPQL